MKKYLFNKNEYILIEDEFEEQLKSLRVYKRKENGRIRYVAKTPELIGTNKTIGLIKLLYGRKLQQKINNNDLRRTNLKNVSSQYYCVFYDQTIGRYKFEFKHNGKKYEKTGFDTQSTAALSHDKIVKALGLDRSYLMEINKEAHSQQESVESQTQASALNYNQLINDVKAEMNEICEIMRNNSKHFNSDRYALFINQLNLLNELLYAIEIKDNQIIDEMINDLHLPSLSAKYLDQLKGGEK